MHSRREHVRILGLGLILVVAVSGGAASAESPANKVAARKARAGYVPKHLRAETPSAATPTTTASRFTATSAVDHVQWQPPASYGEPLAEAVMESPAYVGSGLGSCSSCGQGACVGDCCFPVSLSFQGEYLWWAVKGMDVPALATTSQSTTAQGQAGVLGTSGVRTLFGDDQIGGDTRSGLRLGVNLLLDPQWDQAIAVEYTRLGGGDASFRADASDFSILARPFLNNQTNAEDSRLIVFPGLVTGTLDIRSETEFQTLTAAFRRIAAASGISSMEVSAGYRYAALNDQIQFIENTQSLAGPTNGARFELSEQFRVENQFHGGQLGARYRTSQLNGWQLELGANFAVGNTHAAADVRGTTITTSATGAVSSVASGLLVQGTNDGHFETDGFSTITDMRANLRCHLTNDLSAMIGYSFLWWTDAFRAGESIDRTINPTQIPPGTLTGDARPAFRFDAVDFWAQGVSAGLELRF